MATRTKTTWWGMGTDTTTSGVSSVADKVWVYNATGPTWTDETTDAGSTATADVPLATANGSILYVGCTVPFAQAYFTMSTNASGGARTLEYWNGSTWASLTSAADGGGVLLSNVTDLRWAPPSDWATVIVNTDASALYYYIRFRTTTLHTTAGTITAINVARAIEFSKTIYVPESTPTNMKMTVVTSWHNVSTVGVLRYNGLETRWASEAAEMTCIINDLSSTGEAIAFQHRWNRSTFSSIGTSQTLRVRMFVGLSGQGPTEGIVNPACYVLCTYNYDDTTANNHIKSVLIPIPHPTPARLTTTLAEFGTDLIPALSTFLPEASKTLRQAWIYFDANNATNSTGAYQLGMRIDQGGTPGSEQLFASISNAGNSSCRDFYVWDTTAITVIDANARKFLARTATTAEYVAPIVWLVVTYEFNPSTTTRVLNSVQIPAETAPFNVANSTSDLSSDYVGTTLDFSITEPGTINLRQSALAYWVGSEDGDTYDLISAIRASGGSVTSLTATSIINATTVVLCGMLTMMHRFDTATSIGFATRANHMCWLGLRATNLTANIQNVCATGMLILNYESDKPTNGCGAAAHTVWWSAQPWVHTATQAAFTPAPLIDYNIDVFADSSLVPLAYGLIGTSHLQGPNANFMQMGLAQSAYYDRLYKAVAIRGANENMTADGWMDFSIEFRTRYGTTSAAIPNLVTGMPMSKGTQGASSIMHITAFATVRNIFYTTAITVTGYTGDGSGITVDVFEGDTGIQVGTGTTAVGGTVTITVPSNIGTYYAEARQDSTHVGRSDNLTLTEI